MTSLVENNSVFQTMNGSDNPYESPSHTGAGVLPTANRSATLIISLAKLSFWFGLVLAILGSAITFYPGSECYWFVATGFLLAPGIFVPKQAYRIVAIVACAICLLYAYSGYHRGINYQNSLQSRPTHNANQDNGDGN